MQWLFAAAVPDRFDRDRRFVVPPFRSAVR